MCVPDGFHSFVHWQNIHVPTINTTYQQILAPDPNRVGIIIGTPENDNVWYSLGDPDTTLNRGIFHFNTGTGSGGNQYLWTRYGRLVQLPLFARANSTTSSFIVWLATVPSEIMHRIGLRDEEIAGVRRGF